MDVRDRILKDIKGEAVRRSHGPHPSEELAEMDHPFAKRHGSAQLDPSIANYQSGDLAGAWQTEPLGPDSGRVFNEDAHADLLAKGNKFTLARPEFQAAIETYGEEIAEQYITEMIEQHGNY